MIEERGQLETIRSSLPTLDIYTDRVFMTKRGETRQKENKSDQTLPLRSGILRVELPWSQVHGGLALRGSRDDFLQSLQCRLS